MKKQPVVLAILDGWGIAPDSEGNAIAQAKTPHIDNFVREYPAMTLHASGPEVGLSVGVKGNSEVGHINIGAGRIWHQTLSRIENSIIDKTFFENTVLNKTCEHAKKHDSQLHMIGLLSSSGIHASMAHCFALLDMAKQHRLKKVYIHVVLDGRDVSKDSGVGFVKELQAYMKKINLGKIASVSGRYYAMDRDYHWTRTEKAYNAMAEGDADMYAVDPIMYIQESYAQHIYDSDIKPAVIGAAGTPTAIVEQHDAVLFFNFRPDRGRQLVESFVLPSFGKFERKNIKDVFFTTMTDYEKEIPLQVAFPSRVVHNGLSEVLSRLGKTQLHIAETEKYAHVTYFFNGYIDESFDNEDRIIVPSPHVASYAEKPEMSAREISKQVIKAIELQDFDFIVCNFANVDSVGHTGDFEATKKAVQAVDKVIGTIAEYVLASEGVLCIVADHGNGEYMIEPHTHEKDTRHSNSPVPCIIIGHEFRGRVGKAGDPPNGDLSLLKPVGVLGDIAPTILKIMKLEKPEEMTGEALI